MGFRSPFFVCAGGFADIEGGMQAVEQVLETTVTGLGYDLVDVEMGNRGRFLRIFIDRTVEQGGTITVEDCEAVTRQLQRVLPVEGIDYDRLEVSSPGLDRVVKRLRDFERFVGEKAELKLRLPVEGRRRFTGVLRSASEEAIEIEVEGALHRFPFANVDKARLIPKL